MGYLKNASFVRCAVMGLVIGWIGSSMARAAESNSLPRYKLSVGQELVYQLGRGATVTFYVTRANPNGGWHVFELFRAPGLMVHNPYDRSGIRLTPELKCEFDLMPDGKIGDRPIGPTDHVIGLLPPLQPDAQTADWETSGSVESTIHFHALPATQPALRTFEAVREGPLERRMGIHHKDQIRFDLTKGVPVEFESITETPKRPGPELITFELVHNEIHSASWAGQIGTECGAVVAARQRYWDEWQAARAAVEDQQSIQILDAAVQHLKDARAKVTVPALLEVMDTYIGLHPAYAFYGRGPEALIGRPAPQWAFKDLQGNRHALADYRGKVVVLEFWYRACGYCIIEMPHLKNVARHYADKPVIMLGMNVDADPADAQFIATQEQLPYPILITRAFAPEFRPTTQPAAPGSGIDSTYHVHAYPTLIVIDPDGVVRQVETGGNKDLEGTLISQIDSILPPTK